MTATRAPETATGSRTALDRLFAPGSVAVVGASTTPGKLGTSMLEAVRNSGDLPPTVYGINPRTEAPGFHLSLADATAENGAPLDLAVLCIPASMTPAALQDAVDAGVGGVLICSGGFAEVGPDGAEIQEHLARIVNSSGTRLLGPNTSGFFRPGRATVSFVPTVADIRAGSVAVVAASGGMNHALSFLLSENGIGVGLGVGLGNSVDVTDVDVLAHLRDDPTITAIALHVESVTDGEALLNVVRDVSVHKPIVAVVVGRSDVSAFSESHTGALATSWKTTRALLAEAGAIVVDSERELVDAVAVLSRTRLPASANPGIGLVTAQAGPGLMILDALLTGGVSVPTLGAATQTELSRHLPPMTFQANPVDTGRPGTTFADVLSATAADPSIDALAVYALAEPDAINLAAAVRASGVHERLPVVLGVGGPAAAVNATTTVAAGIDVPVLASPTSLATGVAALVQDARSRYLRSAATPSPIASTSPRIELPADESVAKDLLDELGVSTPPRRVCRDRTAAHAALAVLDLPVAVKILDASVLHKTEIGGVHLGVRTPEELDAALDALDAIDSPAYLVESMAPAGVDLFLGARRDPVFGPIVVAGLGGTAAEAIGDVAIRSHTVSPAAAVAMLDDLQCAALLDGWRGGPVLDRDEYASITRAVVQYLAAHPEISDIEINPLRLTATGLVALDAVVVPADPASSNRSSEGEWA